MYSKNSKKHSPLKVNNQNLKDPLNDVDLSSFLDHDIRDINNYVPHMKSQNQMTRNINGAETAMDLNQTTPFSMFYQKVQTDQRPFSQTSVLHTLDSAGYNAPMQYNKYDEGHERGPQYKK